MPLSPFVQPAGENKLGQNTATKLYARRAPIEGICNIEEQPAANNIGVTLSRLAAFMSYYVQAGRVGSLLSYSFFALSSFLSLFLWRIYLPTGVRSHAIAS